MNPTDAYQIGQDLFINQRLGSRMTSSVHTSYLLSYCAGPGRRMDVPWWVHATLATNAAVLTWPDLTKSTNLTAPVTLSSHDPTEPQRLSTELLAYLAQNRP